MAAEVPTVKYTQLFINNEFVNSASGKTFSSINPSTGLKTCDLQEGDKADIDRAVAAAHTAFARGSEWRTMDASQRGKLLHLFADLLERDLDYLARLETLDTGKPIGMSEAELGHVVSVFRYFAGWCDKITGQTLPADGEYFCYTKLEALGVCGLIVPSYFPMVLLTWKLSAALACGCTVVIKPAEQTPLSALYSAVLFKEAGFPPGVVNVVPGYGPTAGAALVAHPDVDKISFTGTNQVGRVVAAAAGGSLKRLYLGLGGKTPLIVFNDADLDAAVQMAHEVSMSNQGQVCCAGSRTFVQEDIFDAFVERMKAAAEARIIGDPFCRETQHGPQIDEAQFKRVLQYIDVGQKEGAKLVAGGSRHGDHGYFIKPTVFTDVTDTMTIAKEEICGPVQCLLKFKDVNEVIDRSNRTCYGIAAGVCTKNIDNAMAIANGVRGGTVWVNCWDTCCPQAPFGAFKQSGYGRELGADALKEYTEVKTVVIKIDQKNS